jgi:hypothetical protein
MNNCKKILITFKKWIKFRKAKSNYYKIKNKMNSQFNSLYLKDIIIKQNLIFH